ncbi:MAG: response regulator [Aeromicrobium sp.]
MLCIEDDESLGRLVLLILRRVPGIRVLLAASRREAFVVLASTRCDMVLTDLNLPDASGVAWVSELVELPALFDVPVVVMTADATPRTVDVVTAAGATDYLVKPVNRDRLVSVVTTLLGTTIADDGRAAPTIEDHLPPAPLMERCLAESARDLELLREAVAQGDAPHVAWLCHRLRGRAMMYGITEVSDVVQTIETTFRPSQPEIADGLLHRADLALARYGSRWGWLAREP